MPEELQPSLEKPLEKPRLPVAGFWIRAGAIIVDIALLSVIFSYVAKSAYIPLYPYRWWCEVGAALVTFLYFWIGSSALMDGQTLGKMLFSIRVVSMDGGKLSLGQSALRGLIVQLFILAYLFLPQFMQIIGFDILTGFVSFSQGILLPVSSPPAVIGLYILGHLAMTYSLAASVFCAAGPKKQSLHDLVVRTSVVRTGDEKRGVEFVGNWDSNDRAKRKAASYSAIMIAIIILFLLILGLTKASVAFKKNLSPQQTASRELDSSAFHLAYLHGPSEEDYKRFQDYLEARKKREARSADERSTSSATATQQSTPLPPLTTQTLQFPPGRRFQFIFDCRETFTSQSLVADPRFVDLRRKLPLLAERLSKENFKDDSGRPAPYTAIQIEFIETLPLYLYSGIRIVHSDLIPIAGHIVDAAGRQGENEQRRKQQSDQSNGTKPGAVRSQ